MRAVRVAIGKLALFQAGFPLEFERSRAVGFNLNFGRVLDCRLFRFVFTLAGIFGALLSSVLCLLRSVLQ